MRVTIGELANELVKYSNLVETTLVGSIPFTRAYLSTASGHTRLYMYIAQVDEGKYSACTDVSDTGGARFFPTGSISKPFIRELDKIHMLYGGEGLADDRFVKTINKTDYSGMLSFLYQRLIEDRLVRVDGAILGMPFSSLGIRSPKIHRAIEKGFTERNIQNATIGDLVKVVNKRRGKFDLGNLRPRELMCVTGKLGDMGIMSTVQGTVITDITFERV